VLDWLAGDGDDPRGDTFAVWNRVLAALSTATSPETSDEAAASHHLEAAVESLEQFLPLEVRNLRLCRKVLGFGQYETIPGASVEQGHAMLVYCEMVGLKTVESNEGFRSRLSSRVELVPAAGGEPVWSQTLGTAEDVCQRRRRDYFVNYRISLPATVSPGPYGLRLIHTDLLSGRSVSATVDFTVTP
jgi:hypothetical protein